MKHNPLWFVSEDDDNDDDEHVHDPITPPLPLPPTATILTTAPPSSSSSPSSSSFSSASAPSALEHLSGQPDAYASLQEELLSGAARPSLPASETLLKTRIGVPLVSVPTRATNACTSVEELRVFQQLETARANAVASSTLAKVQPQQQQQRLHLSSPSASADHDVTSTIITVAKRPAPPPYSIVPTPLYRKKELERGVARYDACSGGGSHGNVSIPTQADQHRAGVRSAVAVSVAQMDVSVIPRLTAEDAAKQLGQTDPFSMALLKQQASTGVGIGIGMGVGVAASNRGRPASAASTSVRKRGHLSRAGYDAKAESDYNKHVAATNAAAAHAAARSAATATRGGGGGGVGVGVGVARNAQGHIFAYLPTNIASQMRGQPQHAGVGVDWFAALPDSASVFNAASAANAANTTSASSLSSSSTSTSLSLSSVASPALLINRPPRPASGVLYSR